jgi:RNA polymerase sigma factor (sigma-70 family)
MRANRSLAFFAAHIKKLPHLTSREKDVVVGRIEGKTLEVIGEKFNVTEGRVRQIEKEALKKVDSKYVQEELISNE